MKRLFLFLIIPIILMPVVYSSNTEKNDYSFEVKDISDDNRIAEEVYWLEKARTDNNDVNADIPYTVRSPHFIFGMPIFVDKRHYLAQNIPGISLIVREGFVIAYFERMNCPIWVCQRWTRDDTEDQSEFPSLKRDWRTDPYLPQDCHIGTSYAGDDTKLDRGHMSKHSMNRAWGYDNSAFGCLMSNCVPQHRGINRQPGAWWNLEEEVEKVVEDEDRNLETIWTISGAIFRDKKNDENELPEEDFKNVAKITGGFGVPDATYKIVAWFEDNGFFHARGYVFEQPHTQSANGDLSYNIPDQSKELKEFIVPIDEIEERTGIDFFPMLSNTIENKIEATKYRSMWTSK